MYIKKILALLMVLAIAFGVTGCGSEPQVVEVTVEVTTEVTAEPNPTPVPTPTPTPTPEPTPTPTSAPEAAAEIHPVSFKIYANSIGTVYGQIIAEVENTGTVDIHVNNGSYSILKVSDRSVFGTKQMVPIYPAVIAPGEKAYLYDEAMLTGTSADETYTVIPDGKYKATVTPTVRYDVTDFNVMANIVGIKGTGYVTNNTETDATGMVEIAVILFNADGAPICVLYNFIQDGLAAGETKAFEVNSIMPPAEVTVDSVASFTCYAYPVQAFY